MKLAKRFVALLMGATLAAGSAFGLAACGESGTTGDAGDPDIRAVYDLYVENCAANNTTPKTYEQWLASIKGAKGDPGDDGITPHIDPETGNWFIGDTDTGVKAAGTKGTNGTNGKDGNGWLYGETAPADTLGKDGDLYLNYTDWKVYTKEDGHWTERGCIKGADGGNQGGDTGGNQGGNTGGNQGGQPDLGDAVKTWANQTIAAKGEQELDCAGVTPGLYWLVAENVTGVDAANYGVLSLEVNTPTEGSKYGNGMKYEFDLYSPTAQGFKGLLLVDSQIASISQPKIKSASSSSVSATWKLVPYKALEVHAGEQIEVPMALGDGNPAVFGKLKLDNSLLGASINITVTTVPRGTASVVLKQKSTNMADWTPTSGMYPIPITSSSNYTATGKKLASGDVDVCFTGGKACNIVVKFELNSNS